MIAADAAPAAALLAAAARVVADADELPAANTLSSTIESLGVFAGPTLGGLLLAATGVGTVFAAASGGFVCSGLLIAAIRAAEAPAPTAAALGGIASAALAG